MEKERELEVKEVSLDKQSKDLALLAADIKKINNLEITSLVFNDVKILARSDPDTLIESFVFYTKLAWRLVYRFWSRLQPML